MKILLACSAGMSTSILEKNINDYMKANNIEGNAIAYASEQAKSMINKFDVVLIGPQVRFMLAGFKAIAGTTPVAVIDNASYAMGNGQKVYELAKSLFK